MASQGPLTTTAAITYGVKFPRLDPGAIGNKDTVIVIDTTFTFTNGPLKVPSNDTHAMIAIIINNPLLPASPTRTAERGFVTSRRSCAMLPSTSSRSFRLMLSYLRSKRAMIFPTVRSLPKFIYHWQLAVSVLTVMMPAWG